MPIFKLKDELVKVRINVKAENHDTHQIVNMSLNYFQQFHPISTVKSCKILNSQNIAVLIESFEPVGLTVENCLQKIQK